VGLLELIWAFAECGPDLGFLLGHSVLIVDRFLFSAHTTSPGGGSAGAFAECGPDSGFLLGHSVLIVDRFLFSAHTTSPGGGSAIAFAECGPDSGFLLHPEPSFYKTFNISALFL
jgi:hypothetical protein